MYRSILFFLLLLSSQVFGQEEIQLLGTWQDSTLVASRAHDNTYNEIWGLVVKGREYAVIGSTFGTHFIDVTDSNNPEEVFKVAGAAQGASIVHRDYHNMGCYLYAVCDEGQSTLQVMDISGLPDHVEIVHESSKLILRSHNIFIDTTSALLYTFATTGTEIGGDAMGVIDISDPMNPSFIDYYNVFDDIRAGHVHDGYVENDTAFLNCGRDGFAIVDFSDPENPATIATLTPSEYPFAGYNHSGWKSMAGDHYYMADEDHGFDMKVVDISNYNDVTVTSTFNAETGEVNSIPHNPVVACNFLYVAYYYDGLRVYDLEDPANPKLTHFYATSQLQNDRRYKGAWGVYPLLPSGNILVSDMQNGLFVLDGVESECVEEKGCAPITTSVSDNVKELTVSPNPTQDVIMLSGVTTQKIVQLTHLDGMSVKLVSIQSGSNQIDISDLPSGMYIIKAGDFVEIIVKQ
jgi:choice-of-anchor B domain-containing protein